MQILLANSREEVVKFCKIASDERLYRRMFIDDDLGVMIDWYRQPSCIESIGLAYIEYLGEFEYIGCCAIRFSICPQGFVDVGTYIKKEYRMRGFGKVIYKAVKSHVNRATTNDRCGFYRKCA